MVDMACRYARAWLAERKGEAHRACSPYLDIKLDHCHYLIMVYLIMTHHAWFEVVLSPSLCAKAFKQNNARETYHQSPFDYVDISGKICVLAHVTGWEPYDLHALARVCWVRSVLCTYRSCTTFLTEDVRSTGTTVDKLDRHLSDVRIPIKIASLCFVQCTVCRDRIIC